jgi:hypothetical protein
VIIVKKKVRQIKVFNNALYHGGMKGIRQLIRSKESLVGENKFKIIKLVEGSDLFVNDATPGSGVAMPVTG